MRYKDTPINTNSTGDRVYGTTFYPKISIKDSDRFQYFPRGTRFDKIAYDAYGDATLWWIIAVTNGLGKGSLHVPIDTVLRIPANENIQEILEITNLRTR